MLESNVRHGSKVLTSTGEHVMKYRAGRPGWKLFARVGGTIIVQVQVMRDDEAGVYVARSRDLDGLVVEAATLDELRSEVIGAATSLLDLAMNGQPTRAKTDIRLSDSVFCAA